jgi:hypothetical protein
MNTACKTLRLAFVAGAIGCVAYVCFVATTWTPTGGFVSGPSWSGYVSGSFGEIGWPRTYMKIAVDRQSGGVSAWSIEEVCFIALLVNIAVFAAAAWPTLYFGRRLFAGRSSGTIRFGLKSIFVVMLIVSCCAAYWRYVALGFAREEQILERLATHGIDIACGDHSPLLLKRLLSDDARRIFLRAEELYFGVAENEDQVLQSAQDLRHLKHVNYISFEAHPRPDAILKVTREFPGKLTVSFRDSGVSEESLRELQRQDNIAEIILPDAP